MAGRIGFLTIGQSPRVDVVPEIMSILGGNFEVVEAGALDDFSQDEIMELSPRCGETVYVSRLRSGEEVRISKERLIPLLEEKIRFLEDRGVKVIGLLCSGVFPSFKVRVPLVKPEPVLRGMVEASLSSSQILGVVMPSPLQVGFGFEKWSGVKCMEIVVDSVSPYIPIDVRKDSLRKIALNFKRKNVHLVVLDCIGFSIGDLMLFKSVYNVPVLLPRIVLAYAIKSLLYER